MKCLKCKSKTSVVMARMTLTLEAPLRKGGGAKFEGISAGRTAELWESTTDLLIANRELYCNECDATHTYTEADGLKAA